MLDKIYDLLVKIYDILDNTSSEEASRCSDEEYIKNLEYIRKYIDENSKVRRNKNG